MRTAKKAKLADVANDDDDDGAGPMSIIPGMPSEHYDLILQRLDRVFSNPSHNLSHLSNLTELSRRQLKREIKSVASFRIDYQMQKIDQFQTVLSAPGCPVLDFSFDKVKWDEAKQRFAMPMPDINTEQSIAGWNTMRIRRSVGWKLESHNAVMKWDIVVPPVAIIGALNADSFYDAVFCQPLSRRLGRFTEFLRTRSKAHLTPRAGDFDSENLRLVASEVQRMRNSSEKTLHCFFGCSIHQNCKVVGWSLDHAGQDFCSGMFAHMNLLGMGNYWVRTVLAVQPSLEHMLDCVVSAPPGQCTTLFCAFPRPRAQLPKAKGYVYEPCWLLPP
jgi:hypothetical protein